MYLYEDNCTRQTQIIIYQFRTVCRLLSTSITEKVTNKSLNMLFEVFFSFMKNKSSRRLKNAPLISFFFLLFIPSLFSCFPVLLFLKPQVRFLQTRRFYFLSNDLLSAETQTGSF